MPVPELRPEDLDLKPPFYRQCYEGYLARNRHPDASTLQRYLASYYDQLAFIDRQFNTIDVFMMMPVDAIAARYAKRFGAAA